MSLRSAANGCNRTLEKILGTRASTQGDACVGTRPSRLISEGRRPRKRRPAVRAVCLACHPGWAVVLVSRDDGYTRCLLLARASLMTSTAQVLRKR